MTLETTTTALAAELPLVEVWTDGSCKPNPGDGGAVAILRRRDGTEIELTWWMPNTTNNRAELMGPIMALECLKGRRRVRLHTDSEYVQVNFTARLPGWLLNGWKAKKGAIKNRDLWERLVAAADRHEVEWQWVRAHRDDAMNNRADELATTARERKRGKPDQVHVLWIRPETPLIPSAPEADPQ